MGRLSDHYFCKKYTSNVHCGVSSLNFPPLVTSAPAQRGSGVDLCPLEIQFIESMLSGLCPFKLLEEKWLACKSWLIGLYWHPRSSNAYWGRAPSETIGKITSKIGVDLRFWICKRAYPQRHKENLLKTMKFSVFSGCFRGASRYFQGDFMVFFPMLFPRIRFGPF